jgi:hypothetical protein
VRELVTYALDNLRNNPLGDIEFEIISQIGANVGYLHDSSRSLDTNSSRRIHLLLRTARQVFPVWERKFPNDHSPHQCLDLVERVLSEEIDVATIDDEDFLFLDWLDQQSIQCKDEPSLCVAMSLKAILQTLETVFGLYGDSPPHNAENSANAAILFAADAYSYGFLEENRSVVENRRKFWEWWLKHAVPSSWMTPRS